MNQRIQSKEPISPYKVPPQVAAAKTKILFVGEAPGEMEDLRGIPFIGSSGRLLKGTLRDLGVPLEHCSFTNVFDRRPRDNDLAHFCYDRAPPDRGLGLKIGPHLIARQEFVEEAAERLKQLILELAPNVVVPVGGVALKFLTLRDGISAYRGSVLGERFWGRKAIPTYHPAAIQKKWNFLPYFWMDILKIHTESDSPEFQKPPIKIRIHPSLDEVRAAIREFQELKLPLAFDVETIASPEPIITMMSLANSRKRSITIPFLDESNPSASYWTEPQERIIHRDLERLLGDPSIPKVAHNAIYDLMWMKHYGIVVRGPIHDTMLMAHAQMPEMKKGLKTLAPIFLNLPHWKELQVAGRSHKREDE